jgi:hypothetical protein
MGRFDNMDAFDRLPKAVREALRNADHNWSAAQVYHEHKRRKVPAMRTAASIAAFIREQDAAKHHTDAERGLVMGGQR